MISEQNYQLGLYELRIMGTLSIPLHNISTCASSFTMGIYNCDYLSNKGWLLPMFIILTFVFISN